MLGHVTDLLASCQVNRQCAKALVISSARNSSTTCEEIREE